MNIQIEVQGIDRALASMRSALDAIGGKQAERAIANALNQSLAKGRKEASRQARRAYTAPIKKLFDNIRVQRARSGDLSGQIDLLGGQGVSLIHFKAQPDVPQPPVARPAAGVTAQIKRKGARKVRAGKNGGSKSFIMKKKQGGFGVFVRHDRDKFEMLLGPSPIQALQREDAQKSVAERIEESFMPTLQQQIDRALAASLGK